MVASSSSSTPFPIPPPAVHRRRRVVCSADRRALFNRIAHRYDDVRPPSSPSQNEIFLVQIKSHLFCLMQVWVLVGFVLWQLNDLLSLGQHRIWKRMAVSWSGQLPFPVFQFSFSFLIFDAQLFS